MALRHPQVLLASLQRAGVLSLLAGGNTCVVHGLAATPDTVLFSPTSLAAPACLIVGVFLQSWDATTIVFSNSASTQAVYLRVAVEHSILQ